MVGFPTEKMRRSNAPTLQDVAREAGVSAMTVSVVLNGARSATRVSEATRARIIEVAQRLRYRPNAAARGLQRRRMDTLGVIALVDGGELNLYFLEVLNGVLEGAAARGQNTTIFSISNWEKDEARLRQFCDGRVDGMILIGPVMRDEVAESLLHHTPYVTIHDNSHRSYSWNLDIDNEDGAYQIVKHLIDQGHRRILHFTGLSHSGALERLAGYRRALAEAGIPLDDSLVIPCGFSESLGYRKMLELLDQARLDPLPTAVFGASDAIAAGCITALNQRNLRVPEAMSVVGFDDTLAARTTTPPLTTIRQPFRALGRRSVEMLLSQIEASAATHPDSESPELKPHTEVFAVELIQRGSVGPPPILPLSPPYSGPER